MKKRKTVYVNKDDIKYGQAADCYSCPVACAITRATGRQAVVIGPNWSFRDRGDQPDLPRKASLFIENFDEGKRPLKPFNFTLFYNT